MNLQRVAYRLKNMVGKRAIVLMYHRVADLPTDPWDLAVTPANFETQLQVLRNMGNVISLQQLYAQLTTNALKNGSIALTFDDGYTDNYAAAKPLLEKYEVPATFFLTNACFDSEGLYWWDELEKLVLHTNKLPPYLNIGLPFFSVEFDLSAQACLSDESIAKIAKWKADAAPVDKRTELFTLLYQKLIKLAPMQQKLVLSDLQQWAGDTNNNTALYTRMSINEVKNLSQNELFEVGAHTVGHTALGYQPAHIQTDEITISKSTLEQITGKAVTTFSYPNGSYDASAINIISQSSFAMAFTTDHQIVRPSSHRYELGRFQVNNWSEPLFKKRLSLWLKGF